MKKASIKPGKLWTLTEKPGKDPEFVSKNYWLPWMEHLTREEDLFVAFFITFSVSVEIVFIPSVWKT